MSATPSTIPSKEDSPEEEARGARRRARVVLVTAAAAAPARSLVVGPESASNPTPRADLDLAGPVIATPSPAPRNSPPTPRPSTAEGPAPSPPRTFRGHVARGEEHVVERAFASHTYFERLFSALDPPALRRMLADDATRARVPRAHQAGVARNPLVEMKKAAKGATALRALGCALDRDARHVKPSLAKTPPRDAPRRASHEGNISVDVSETALAVARDASAAAAAGKPLAFLFPDGALWRKRDRSPERFSPDAEAEAFSARRRRRRGGRRPRRARRRERRRERRATRRECHGVPPAATPSPAPARAAVPSPSRGSNRAGASTQRECHRRRRRRRRVARVRRAAARASLPRRLGVILALGRIDPVLSARASSSSLYVLPVGFVSGGNTGACATRTRGCGTRAWSRWNVRA